MEPDQPSDAPVWLLCPVCATLLSAPFALPCSHTFCDSCVCRLVSDAYDLKTGAFGCPLCRASVSVDLASPKQIAQMFSVDEHMLENVSLYLSQRPSSPSQSNQGLQPRCSAKECDFEASKYCSSGCGFLCPSCLKQHKGILNILTHKVVDVPHDPDNKALCHYHPTRQASNLCYSSDASKFLCIECVQKYKSSEGTLFTAKEGTDILAKDVQGYISDCESKMHDLEKKRIDMEQMIDKGEDKKEKLKEQIHSEIESLRGKAMDFIKSLEELEVRLMEKLDEMHDEIWKPSKIDTHELATSEQIIQHARELAMSSLKSFEESRHPNGLIYSRNTQSAVGKGFSSLLKRYEESQKEHEKMLIRTERPISRGVYDNVDIRVGKITNSLRKLVDIDVRIGDEAKILQIVKPGKGRVWAQREISNYKNLIKMVGVRGSGPLQFDLPWGIAVHPHTGNLYITDQENHRVQVLSPDLEFVTTFGCHGSKDGEFITPTGIAISAEGYIFVADDNGGEFKARVQAFDNEHIFFSKVPKVKKSQAAIPSGVFPGFHGPRGMAFDLNGNLYVADLYKHSVYKFNSDLEHVLSFANTGEGRVAQPHNIWLNSKDEICVHGYAEKASFFNFDGKYLRTINSLYFREWSNGQEGPDGTMFFTDLGGHKVFACSSDGKVLFEMSGNGTEDGRFNNPQGICFGLDGRLYVLECENRRVQCFGAN